MRNKLIDITSQNKTSGLYIVSTPIGNMADITIRALQVLSAADFIYSEDTRQTSKLLNHYGIDLKTRIYNEHNAKKARPEILQLLSENKMIALVSDAGTPLISDPGYKLVQAAINSHHKVVPVPGASSVLASLVASGMPVDQFHFAGFVDKKKLHDFAQINSTILFFESPKRLLATLHDMKTIFSNRSVCVAREITKFFEEFVCGSFEEAITHYIQYTPKGEVVILLSPPQKQKVAADSLQEELQELLQKYKLKEAAEILAAKYNISKKEVYEYGIKTKNI